MIATARKSTALVMMFLATSAVQAGDPPTPPAFPGGSTAAPMPGYPPATNPDASSGADFGGASASTTEGGQMPMPEQAPPNGSQTPPQPGWGLSSWLLYERPGCCGPVGGSGPIKEELYTRTGPSLTYGDGILGHLLRGSAGWDFQAGGRSLFFNPQETAAWTVDLGLDYFYNHSSTSPMPIIMVTPPTPVGGRPLPAVPVPVTVRMVQRTFADLALGREWYLRGSADSPDLRWRIGCDVGGRLGTAKINFDQIPHGTDTIYGVVTALHTDLEKSCGCCTFMAGFRAEWDYTWTDLLQKQNDGNIQDVSLLITLGVRF